jgi:LPXTG-motif cell wall-anchored protein
VVFATVVAGGAMAASATVAGADDEAPVQVQTFAAEDFASEAAELPGGLAAAVERDLGLSAEQYLADAAAGKVAADVLTDLRDSGVGVNGGTLDGQELTIYVASDSDVAAAEATGAKVVKGQPETPSFEGKEWEAQPDFKGGFGYGVFPEGGGEGGRCSNGLNGTSGGSLVTITAGHCGGDFPEGNPFYEMLNDEPVFSTGTPEFGDVIGTIGAMHFGDSDANDAGLLNLSGADWTAPPTVSIWGGQEGSKNDGEVNVYDATVAVNGMAVCKSGATTGWRCGEIVDDNETVELSTGESVQGFIYDACGMSGDSGGSVLTGNYALGMNSFGTFGIQPSCDGYAEGNNFGGAFSLSNEFDGSNGEDLFGDAFDLSIFVGATTLNETQVTTGSGIAISGKADSAIGSTMEIVISGDAIEADITLNATVGDDQDSLEGAHDWSATLDEALPEGDYTYTATATHTAMGASQVTTGEPNSGEFTVIEVAELTIEAPSDGQTVDSGNRRPAFNGTGEPGGEVTLTVGDNEHGSATIDDEGNWTIEPDSDLPHGVRFDATVTQAAKDTSQSQTVSDLGIKVVPGIELTTPEDGSTVSPSVVFEGTAHPDTQVGLLLTPADASSDSAPSSQAGPGAQDEHTDVWEGDFVMDDEGNWTFTPAEELAEGDYTIKAIAGIEGGDEELSMSEDMANFTVKSKDDGDDDDDLPDTGTNNMPFIALGIGLVLAGGAFVAIRTIRGRSIA